MSKNKLRNTIITEEEFTKNLQSIPNNPQDDSPGDSEADAGLEFLMGMNYIGADTDGLDEISSGQPAVLDTQAPNKMPAKTQSRGPIELPDSAKVISSDLPSPWMDQEAPSDTH